MAYQPHTYVTAGGTLSEVADGDEIWQVGVRGFNTGGGPVDESQLQALAQQIAVGPNGTTGLAQWASADHTYFTPGTLLKWVKCANIGPSGDYIGDPAIYELPTPAGDNTSPQGPAFITVALSWTTGKSFGKARYGRIYPPNFGCPRDGGSKISAAGQTNLVQSALQFLSSVDQSADQFDFNPYVVSRSGVSNPITGVRVGNLYDVQRRRKNAVAETYQAAPR